MVYDHWQLYKLKASNAMFVIMFGFQEIEEVNNYRLHVLNAKAHTGTNRKGRNNDSIWEVVINAI